MAVGLRVLIAALLALELPMAGATLGGDSASIENDRAAMRVAQAARQTMSASGRYSVHESVLPNGVLVRQYVSAGDKVFAVSWSGPYLPDLRQLLGAHFDTMTERKTKQPRLGHSTVSQHEADLVIESGGHPHSFAGRAYLPQALPAGVDVQEIR
jgi:hypothetical protein